MQATWRKVLQQFLIQILQGAETHHNMLEQHILGKKQNFIS